MLELFPFLSHLPCNACKHNFLRKKKGSQNNLYFFFKNGYHPFLVEGSVPRVSLREYFPSLDLGGCAKIFLFGLSKKCMD